MKKIILSALCALATLSASAQSEVNLLNLGAPVTFNGSLLGAADGFTATVGIVDGGSFTAIKSNIPFAANGLFSGGKGALGVAYGTSVNLRVDVSNGTFSGSSNVFPASQGSATLPASNLGTLGMAGFDIDGSTPVIPEPSTIALAVLGGAALMLRRRK